MIIKRRTTPDGRRILLTLVPGRGDRDGAEALAIALADATPEAIGVTVYEDDSRIGWSATIQVDPGDLRTVNLDEFYATHLLGPSWYRDRIELAPGEDGSFRDEE